MADDRGESMVQKHTERLQKEKEEAAMSQIKEELPSISPAVLALALQEAQWEVVPAIQLVQMFLNVRGIQLAELQKALQKKQMLKPLEQAASSGDSSGDSGGDERKKKKRSGKERSKSRKKQKHDRKESRQKEKDKLTNTERFGKYGIVRETDFERFRSEFVMWAAEAKGVNVESLPKWEEKDFFKTYMEDYNTGTLPHKKYYDLDLYERKRALKAAKKGATLEAEKAQFNDEADVAARRHREAMAAQQERLREAYNELKYTAPDKVEAMRDQEMTRMQMNLAYRTGDRDTAEKLANRLKPDEPIWKDGVLQPPKV
ncbi:hypothetical protein WJX75_008954 [Coccomyxa subellipsoidea]|uniref:Uncharacterized protein n=1 Tax=Coccomyxa subellipsoidea TaxID=248742 RepID=A0ABR2YIP4_9CHLO